MPVIGRIRNWRGRPHITGVWDRQAEVKAFRLTAATVRFIDLEIVVTDVFDVNNF